MADRAAAHVGTYTVSTRGQLSLPAGARRRWGLEHGGKVDVLDLGGLVVLVPGGSDAARRLIREAVTPEVYARAVAEIDDPDLAVP